MTKYLLSTGETTTKLEEYVLDLFKMNLHIRPKDIPHYNILGFDFTLVGISTDQLHTEIKRRLDNLIQNIQSLFDKSIIKISLDSLNIINEEIVSVVIKVNNYISNEIKINI
jgi:hypothetical protein